MAIHCLRCGNTRRGQKSRPCTTPDCYGQLISFPRSMAKVVTLFHSLGYDVGSAYAMHPVVPYDGGIYDETVFVCLSFGRMYDEDAFPMLPPEFQVLQFENENSTRLSYYAEFYMGQGTVSVAKKDMKAAIGKLLAYGEEIEAKNWHHILALGGRL